MKKLAISLAALAVTAMVSAPTIAATQWNFGGRLAYKTFWTQNHSGKERLPDLQGGGKALKNDGYLDWGTQANTQLQIYARADRFKGYIEMGWDYDRNSVWTREYWGDYRFNDMLSITVGQQHQLFSQLNNQVWGGDWDSNGIGTAFAAPTPKITINYGNFHFALSKPYDKRVRNEGGFSYKVWDSATSSYVSGFGSADINTYIPQLQASYLYFADTWKLHLGAGYQWTQLDDIAALNGKDKNIHSWIITAEGDIDFGPLYLQLAASVGQNWSDAGWNDESSAVVDPRGTSYFNQNMGVHVYKNKLKDTTSAMIAFTAGYHLTEALRFEGGAAYRYDDNNVFHDHGNAMNFYLQAAYTIAPGFVITPEIGYIDYGKAVGNKAASVKSKDQGYLWYAGAQWAMYF